MRIPKSRNLYLVWSAIGRERFRVQMRGLAVPTTSPFSTALYIQRLCPSPLPCLPFRYVCLLPFCRLSFVPIQFPSIRPPVLSNLFDYTFDQDLHLRTFEILAPVDEPLHDGDDEDYEEDDDAVIWTHD